MKLVLHSNTQKAIQGIVSKPSQALLIIAPEGAGKGSLALYIACKVLNIDESKLLQYPYKLQISPVDQAISIDTIRSVQQFMRLKTTGRAQAIRRLIIIEGAETLTIEAQNAFLKMLEEPPADTIIIMTCANEHSLLPTIMSRVQSLRVTPPSKASLDDYYTEQGFDQTDVDKAFYISHGQPGLMAGLLNENSDHPLIAHIETAKRLLSASTFERLTMVDQLSKQRTEMRQLIRALQLTCHAALTQASQRGQLAQVKRWHGLLSRLNLAERYMDSNPNLKLLMTDLSLGL